MAGTLPWFRLYSEAVDDPKLKLLSFEDRWHFVAILCCKCQGLFGRENKGMTRRMIAVKLGLDSRELDEVARRLSEVELIDRETLEPLAWNDRQFTSDNSTDRVKRYRERQKKQQRNGAKRDCNVAVTAQDTDTDTDTELMGASSDAPRPQRPKAKSTPYEAVMDAYNRLCPSMKTCRALNDKRKRRIKKLTDTLMPTLAHWEAYFADCEDTDKYTGRVPPRPPYDEPFRGWFDFILRDDTVTAVLER